MEFLSIEERIRLAILIGESQYREFKSVYEGPPNQKTLRQLNDIQRDISKTLVAFANADGGELIIGIEDNGTISGVPYSEEKLEALLRAPETHVYIDTPLPAARKALTKIDDKPLIYFAVSKGTEYVHLTSDGRCLRRRDRDSLPCSSETIQADRLESLSREYERQVAPGAVIADLNMDLIESVAGQIAYGISVEKCLQYLDLADFGLEGLSLKKAALLLFAKDVKRWHTGCTVRIMTINGKEKRTGKHFNVVRDEIISKNILNLIDESWQRLTVSLLRHTQLTDQAKFEEIYLYPEIACREALVNAIVHRNYAIEGRGIEVEIYSDRIEIHSPGMLLSTISLEDIKALKGVHESRNPLIARVLREVGFIREMGEGVRRIYDVMRSNALAEPEFENKTSGFTVSLFHRSLYDPKVKLWLSNFEKYKLPESQMAVIALGFGGNTFSTQDVIDRLGIIDTDHVREVLTPLRQQGLIERVMSRNVAFFEAAKLRIPKREVKVFRVLSPLHHLYETDKKPIESLHPEKIIEPLNDLDEETSQATEFFIANLPYNATRDELYDFLKQYGEIVSFNMPKDYHYSSSNRGYAFATFTLNKSENEFLREVDGKEFGGRRIHIRRQNL